MVAVGDSGTGRRRAWRWLLPALAIVAWVLVGAVLGPLAGKTSQVQRNDNSAFLPRSTESSAVIDLTERFVRSRSTAAILVYDRGSGLTADDRSKIASDVARIAAHLDGKLAGPPVGPVISKDGRAAQVILLLNTSEGSDLRTAVDWVRGQAGGTPGLAAHVTGPGGMLGDFMHAFAGIDGVLLLVTGGIVLLILIMVYRSPILPFVVLGSAGCALAIANGVVYLLARHGTVTLNGQIQGILDVLVLGAATDYALLLVSRYREELRRHADRYRAIRVAWRASLAPIVASGGTVIIALLCLLVSDLATNRGLGPVGAIGIACSVLAMLTLLPALLVLLGRAAFWPFRPRVGERPAEERGVWARVAGQVGRRHRVVWVGTAVVLLVLTGGLVRLNANGIPQGDSFTVPVDSKIGQQVLGDHFPAGAGEPITIITRAGRLVPVVDAVRHLPGVAQVTPYTGAAAGPGDAAPLVVDGLARVDVTMTAAPDSPAAYDLVRRVRAAAHAVPGADAKVGGFSATNLDVQDTARRDRNVIIPIVLLVVFVILMLLLRSVLAPLMLVLTVVLSFFATLGVSGVVFRDVFGFTGTDSSFPLYAFVFLVALGVDYNIFLMTRVREEVARRGRRDGVLAGLAVTGGVITSAGLVLAATFAALSVLPLVFLAEIAFTVAFGVLLDTLVVRSLLVPAATIEMGRLAWWPGRPDREVDVTGSAAEPARPAGEGELVGGRHRAAG